jgi:hypothetical protein
MSKTTILRCMSCPASAEVASTSNVGQLEELSGFRTIMIIDTSMRWLCPSCIAVLVPHVRAIVDLLKCDDVFWNGLPHLLKDKS